MKRFINWLTSKISPRKASKKPAPLSATGKLYRTGGHTIPRSAKPRQAVPDRQPEFVNIDTHVEGRVEDRGPGKNVLIRNKYVREDSGTHETLKILDDSIIDTEEEEGIDPYNTGQFDRSRNWDRRTK
ncbi:MAG: hypothetical protein P8X81_09160 [Woeseiaceae bacterium]|jgi:hypothetical protein